MRTQGAFLVWAALLFGSLPCSQARAQGPALEECTTAVISGRATAGGRPLLWKNRDTNAGNNKVLYFPGRGKRLAFLGLVTAGKGERSCVWAGINEAGFAIMNSASDDLDGPGGDKEGEFMKSALERCRRVTDFGAILEETDRPGREVNANFGVIDALGGAAYFETGCHKHRRFDASDPAEAPLGVLVRANFAFSGTGKGSGFGRYERARRLLEGAAREGRLGAAFLLAHVTRDLFTFLRDPYPLSRGARSGPLDTKVTICRRSTKAVALFRGVKKGEDPGRACFWVILGNPCASVAVPLFVKAGPPPLLVRGEPGKGSSLWDAARKLYLRLLVSTPEKGLLDLRLLAGKKGRPGVRDVLLQAERANFRETARLLAGRKTPSPRELRALEERCARRAWRAIQSALLLCPKRAPVPAGGAGKGGK